MRILFYGFRHNHIRALYKKAAASPRFEIVGCVETNDAARAAAEEALGVTFSDRSYESLLEERDLDAVAIGCAYGERGAAVLAALRAGKHVIADKPLCTSLEELAAIRALSAAGGLKVGCMLDLRDMPQTAAAWQILSGGTLGEVRNIAINGQHALDYGRRPMWYFEPGMHGGTINDLAIHGIDLVRLLTGMEIVHIDAARTWNAYATAHPDFRDCALFMARLENGAGVVADVSYSAPPQAFRLPSYWEFRIWCERGLLTFSYNDPVVRVYAQGAEEVVCHTGAAPKWDYLNDFADEVSLGTVGLTEGVLKSTETALRLQAFAD